MKIKAEAINISQGVLIDKISIYLKQRDLDAKLSSGYCFGLALLWAYQKRIGQEKDFFDLIKKIASWNEEDDLDTEFEKLFSKIDWLQNTEKLLSSISQSKIQEKIGEIDSPIQVEYGTGFLLGEKEIIALLETLFKNENKSFLISSHNHATAVVYEDGLYKFYDSNSEIGVVEFKSIVDLVTDKEKGLLQAFVFENSRLDALKALVRGKLWPKKIPFIIKSFDLKGELFGVYPKNFVKNIIEKNTKYKDIENSSSWDGVTAAWIAAKANDIENLKMLKERNVDFNKKDNNGLTPLFAAVSLQNYDSVLWLLDNGADINILYKDSAGFEKNIGQVAIRKNSSLEILIALLAAAIKQGNEDMAIDLIDVVFTPDSASSKEEAASILHTAIEFGTTQIIEELLYQLPELINIKDQSGKDALSIALDRQDKEKINFLSKFKLQESIKNGNLENVKKILQDFPHLLNEVSTKKLSPLQLAIVDDSFPIFEFLINKGADINQKIGNYTLLHFAAEKGNTKVIDLLIKNGITRTKEEAESPLGLATQRGNLEAFKQLVALGEATDITDDQKNSLLHIAIQYGHFMIAKELINIASTNLNSVNGDGQTPLMLAVIKGAKEIVDLLLAQGADTSIKTQNESTLLHHAAALKDNEILKILVKHNLDTESVDDQGNKPIHKAIRANKLENVKYFLDLNPDTLKDNAFSLLKTAIESNHIDIIKYLIEEENILKYVDIKNINPFHWLSTQRMIDYFISKGFDINAKDDQGRTALHIAAQRDDLTYAQLLIANGADISIEDNNKDTPKALIQKDSELEKLFAFTQFCLDIKNNNIAALRNNPNKITYANEKNATGDTPLHIAIKNNSSASLINFLLKECQANPLLKNNEGNTALHLATQHSPPNIINMLMSVKDVNVYVRNKNGETMLHMAIQKGKEEVVDLLIQKNKTFIRLQDNNKRLPLHHAIFSKNLVIINQLLKAGANINAIDAKGQTPLHLAVLQGESKIIEFLIKKGANLDIKDKSGLTPLDAAKQNQKILEVMDKLQSKRVEELPQKEALLNSVLDSIRNSGVKGDKKNVAERLVKELALISPDQDLSEYVFSLKEKLDATEKSVKKSSKNLGLFSTGSEFKKMMINCKNILDAVSEKSLQLTKSY